MLGLGPELLERERELEQLDRALADVLAGEGRVVLIQGSPGIGKSRLLDALCARANGSARVLRGRGGELERDVPFAVVRELFEPVVARTSDAERSRLLAGAAGLAGPLLGVGSSEPGATDSAFAVMHGLYWLTANLAEAGPLVLAVDDAHWTDEATQRWLAYLVPRIAELPVLLMLALRPREVDPTSQLARALASLDAMLVEPDALGVDGTGGLICEELGTPEVTFRDAVHRATGGNPLLVRTLAAALAAKGITPTADNAHRVQAIGLDRVGRIVLPRVHQLGRDAVKLARAAGILGENPHPADVRGLAALDEPAATGAAEALTAAEVLRRDGSLGFTHPLVRAAVVDELSPQARSELHLRAAVILGTRNADPDEIARHLLATGPVGEEWAVSALRAAASRATAQGSPESAVGTLQRALREPVGRQLRAEILFELGSAAYSCRHPRAVDWLTDALGYTDDPPLWIRCWIACVQAAVLRGERIPLGRIMAEAPPLDGDLILPFAATVMANYGFAGIRPRSAHRALSPAVEPRGDTDYQRMWLAAAALDEVMECTSADRAIELADRVLACDTFLADASESWPSWVVIALLYTGQLTRALRASAEAGTHGARRGSRMAIEWLGVLQAVGHFYRGDLLDAESDIADVVSARGDHGFVLGRSIELGCLADVLRERGVPERAEAVLAEHDLLDAPPPPHAWGASLLEARGRLHLAQRRIDQALSDLRACGELLERIGIPHSVIYQWRAGAAECLAALGDRAGALRLASEQVADARRFGAAPWLGSSLRVLGTVTGGEEGIALLREAVEVLGASEARLEHAHALCDLGVSLRHHRRPTEARDPLRQALDVAERCGAHALADRAAEELAVAGARVRRRAITGADSLTPSERRVAVLAAQGRSNPDIAQSLFVTRKTVEKHLGNAFLKLQITSRAELPAALSVDV